MADNCEVLDILAEQDPVRIPFENTPTIEYYHNTLPRLSTNKDLLDDDYNQAWAGFITAFIGFFLIWGSMLGFFKWRGPEKAGWISGSRTTKQTQVEEPSSNDNGVFSSFRILAKKESTAVENKKALPKKQSMFLRILLYITIFGIITANGILYFTGLKNLSSATDEGLATLDQAEAQMKLSVCLFEQVIDRMELAENNTQELLKRANNICPRVQNQFCQVLSDPDSCGSDSNRRLLVDDLLGWAGYAYDLASEQAQTIVNFLQSMLQSMQNGIQFFQKEVNLKVQLQLMRDDLNGKIEANLVDTKDQVETAALMVTLSSVLCLISTLVCIGLLAAHFLKKPRLLKVFFGFFIFTTVLIIVAAIAITIAAFVVSDLCIDDPDTRAIELLLLRLDLKSEILENVARGFFESMADGDICFEEPPTEFLTNSIDFVQEGMDAFDGWSGFFNGFDSIQELACGADATSFADVEAFMETSINAKLNITAVFLESAGQILTCSFWLKLFEKGLHQATCYDGMEALATVAPAQFIIACLCMLVVTFRVVLWDTIILEADAGGTENHQST
ncbi:unnamed protein product [Cylindrotheca closterium]|uniref:Uncharacterized protein n=1 Tax=Cylindrotheca closterium TaxID=2856 RepID=A0AAD2FCZ3_9STRA|nr:unnamed protein product [Cylindrotheca closterium]